MTKKVQCYKMKKNSGFTLLELSVVILLLGVVIALVSTAYQAYQTKQKALETQQRITTAAEKIYEFRKINGMYPCPAPLTSARTAASYGMPKGWTSAANPQGSCLTAGTAGACSGGTCIQSSTRTDITSPGNVEIGALPFRQLGIPEAEAYDAYGSRIVYAITKSMTDKDKIREGGGGIEIRNEENKDLVTPTGSGAFMIISPGKDKLGAYGPGGTVTRSCTAGRGDTDNCDYLTGATEAKFRARTYSESTTAATSHFDDITAFNVPEERTVWRKGLVEKNEKNDDIIDMAESKIVMSAQKAIAGSSAQLSILYDASNPNYDGSLYVRPDPAKADTGRIIASKLCDNGGTNCFKVSELEKDCSTSGQYVIGIWSGQVQCGALYLGCTKPNGDPSNPQEIPDNSKYIKGFDNTGKPICVAVPPEPIDGVCGGANAQTDLLTTPTPTNSPTMCKTGNPSSVSGDGSAQNRYKWTCYGADGGGNVNCGGQLKPPPIDGICGSDNGATLTYTPTNLCIQGNIDNFTGNGPWSWYCRGYGDAGAYKDVKCSAALKETPLACSASDVPIVTPPTNLPITPFAGACDNSKINGCQAGRGNAIEQSADSSYNYWKCSGVSGGKTSDICKKAKPVVTTPGACNNNQVNGCTNGGAAYDVTSDSLADKWRCHSPDGGTDSDQCQKSKVTTTPGACDNTVKNGCTNGGTAFDITSDTLADKWKCHSPNGGTDSGQCQKGVPCSDGTKKLVDVYFLADNTGSMLGPITSIKNKALNIMNKISGGDARFVNVDARFAVGRYFGDPSEGAQQTCPPGYQFYAFDIGMGMGSITGCSSDGTMGGTQAAPVPVGAYDLMQPFTNSISSTQNALNGWQANWGGDVPEGQFYALNQLATSSATGWRSNAGKIVIWMGDAYGHQETTNLTTTINSLKAKKISVIALKVISPEDTAGINSIDRDGQANAIVTATGGTLSNIEGLSDDQIATIIVNNVSTVVDNICH